MSFYICSGSCENRWVYAYGAHPVVALSPVAFWRNDDIPYTNQGATAWGTTTTGVDKNSTLADFQAIYDQSAANPGMQLIDSTVPNRFRVAGDHAWGGNDWDHTLTKSELSSPIGATTQPEVNAHWAVGFAAFMANDLDNPAYVVPAEVPSAAYTGGATPTESNYIPQYYKVGFAADGSRNDDDPFIECFTIDTITSRDPIETADRTALGILPADVVMIGSLQEAQLLADLAASTATFKCIFSSSKLFANSLSDNGNIWAAVGTAPGYEVQRNRILAAIQAASGWAVPGGVFWISGDRHLSCIDVKTVSGGDSWDVVNVTAGMWNKDGVAGTQDGTQTLFLDNTKIAFAAIKVDTDHCEISIREALTSKIMAKVDVLAGGNKYSAKQVRAAI